jgi:hypothetical protein
MGTKPALAKLERVPLRDIWGDEAKDFTPWLASDEGLSLVGEVIGIDLELVDTEVAVGPYWADILARAAGNETHKVVIENQLGKTDHDHLGKIITYAAGLGARTLVWVSDRFCDEHREALDFLNENTGEALAFYGLEIHALRIANSLPAPQFSVISSPNVTTKAAREKIPAADRPSTEELMALATKRNVQPIVTKLLTLGPPVEHVLPLPSRTYGGSFRCWRKDSNRKDRMVLGINVSGERKQTPQGQLDVWLPIPSLALVADISVDEAKKAFEKLPTLAKESIDWIVRLKSEADAENAVAVLSKFFETN